MQAVYVWSLVRELEFHMPKGTAKKILKKKKSKKMYYSKDTEITSKTSVENLKRVEEKIP